MIAAVGPIRIADEDPVQDDVRALFAASDAYHSALYPAESNHFVGPEAMVAANAVFLVARDTASGRAIGCGALVYRPSGEAEIKRMWVDPAARGAGIGRRLLERLLAEGRQRGVAVVRLETGVRQPEALGLYTAAGFTLRPPFGDYVEDPNSVFMELRLSA